MKYIDLYDLPRWTHRPLRFLRNIKWWVLHRTFYRYHILRLRTKPGYSDVCEVMLRANFVLLEQFMEEEFDIIQWYLPKKDKIDDWEKEYYSETSKVADELKILYNWWQNRKNNDDPSDEELSQDDLMLARLIKIRKYMWT